MVGLYTFFQDNRKLLRTVSARAIEALIRRDWGEQRAEKAHYSTVKKTHMFALTHLSELSVKCFDMIMW